MSFVRKVGWTLVTKITITVLGIASSIVVARYLGPHDKGVLAAVTALSGIALQLGNLGLPSATTYFLSRDRLLLAQIIGSSVWAATVLGGLIALIAYMAVLLFPSIVGDVKTSILAVSIFAVPFMFFTSLAQNILLALQKIRLFNLLDLGANLASVASSVIIVIVLHRGADWLLVVGTILSIVVATVYFFGLELRPSIKLPNKLFKSMLGFGVRSYVANLLAYLVIRSDLLLVTHYLGNAETGIYSVAAFAVDALYLISIITGTIFFPIATANPTERDNLTARVLRILSVLMLVVLTLGGLVAYFLIPWFYGQSFAGAVVPTLILLPGIYFLSLETILMNNFASRGFPIRVIFIVAAGLVVNLVGNMVAIPTLGINGAAITSSIAYLIMFVLALRYFMGLSHLSWRVIFIPTKKDLAALIGGLRRLK